VRIELFRARPSQIDVVFLEPEIEVGSAHEHVVSSTKQAVPSRALAARSRESPGAVAVRALADLDQRDFAASSTSSAWPVLSLAPLAPQDPLGSNRNVLRSMPRYFLPYRLFSLT